MILIAEIGNNHFGDLEKAKELISAAQDSGATRVKLQAFLAKDIKSGSMPTEFYEQCAFTMDEYLELIRYGEEKRIEVFYSIFSPELNELKFGQRSKKISGKQTIKLIESGQYMDFPYTFISFPKTHLYHAIDLQLATPLYVTEYLPIDPELFRLDYLKAIMCGRPYGYSDHTPGIRACELAARVYGARVIEKHFTMEKDMKFKGVIFRDTVHGATPKEFAKLAKSLKI